MKNNKPKVVRLSVKAAERIFGAQIQRHFEQHFGETISDEALLAVIKSLKKTRRRVVEQVRKPIELPPFVDEAVKKIKAYERKARKNNERRP